MSITLQQRFPRSLLHIISRSSVQRRQMHAMVPLYVITPAPSPALLRGSRGFTGFMCYHARMNWYEDIWHGLSWTFLWVCSCIGLHSTNKIIERICNGNKRLVYKSTCCHPFRTLPQDVVNIIQEFLLIMPIPITPVYWLKSPHQADNSIMCHTIQWYKNERTFKTGQYSQ